MLHYFRCHPNTFIHKEIRQQPNGDETFRLLAHVKRRVPNRSETSGSVSWIFEFWDNLLSSLCGIWNWMLRSISVTCRLISRVVWLAFDFIQQCKLILQFCWQKLALISHLRQVYVTIFILTQMFKHGFLAWSWITVCEMVNKTS